MKYCKCGCGETVLDTKTWVRGHHARSDEHKDKVRRGKRLQMARNVSQRPLKSPKSRPKSSDSMPGPEVPASISRPSRPAREQEFTVSDKPLALGVFIYAGGFSVGVREHFDIVAHLEDGPFGNATVRHNMPELELNNNPARWYETYDRFRGQIDLVHSNPPCAPWSMAGRAVDGARGLTNSDERVKCVFQSYEVFEHLDARAWIWESVARTSQAGRPIIRQLAERGADRGFSTTVVVFNGLDLGIPQERKRTFVVQHDFSLDFEKPRVPRRVVRDVLTDDIRFDPVMDIANMSTAERNMLPHTNQGGSLRDAFNRVHGTPLVHPDRQVVRGRPSFIRRRLAWDRPSFTVVGGPHLFHPDEPRLLSVQEVAAVCCYPRDYQFVGRINDRYAQIAKAVLPPAGEWVARHIRAGLDRNEQIPELKLTYIDFTQGGKPETYVL